MSQTPSEHALNIPKATDCIACGLCIPTCPTWQTTGRETQSPRGRVRLMRANQEGRLEIDATFAQEMDDCLVCRRCESVCPAGVSFGGLMEETRESMVNSGFAPPRSARFLLGQVLHPGRLSFGMGLLRIAQRMGIAKNLGSMAHSMPAVPPKADRQRLPDFVGAKGTRQGEVWLLEGCVMPELYGRVNRAAVRLLQHVGYDVRIPKPRLCCGALHAHAGLGEDARKLAGDWMALAQSVGLPDAIVSTSAGCGAHLAELPRVLAQSPETAEDASAFSSRVLDASAFLARPENLSRLEPDLAGLPAEWLPLAYDDPCHLCHGQGVRDEPRRLLDAISGVKRVELTLAEDCCGSAGLHSLLHPDSARDQLSPKLIDLDTSGAATLVTANPGCQMQWDVGQRDRPAPKPVRHLLEVLAQALKT